MFHTFFTFLRSLFENDESNGQRDFWKGFKVPTSEFFFGGGWSREDDEILWSFFVLDSFWWACMHWHFKIICCCGMLYL